MYKYESSIFIKRPPQEVFDYVSNPANDVNWRGGTQSAEWTSAGLPGVGSTIKVITSMLGRKIQATAEVAVWDPPSLFTIKAIGGPVPFEGTIKLAAQGEGTLLTQTGQAEISGFFKLAEGLVGRQLDKQTEANNVALKSQLEAGRV